MFQKYFWRSSTYGEAAESVAQYMKRQAPPISTAPTVQTLRDGGDRKTKEKKMVVGGTEIPPPTITGKASSVISDDN